MGISILLLLVKIFTCSYADHSSLLATQRYIDWDTGYDNIDCLVGMDNRPCKTLNYACTNISNESKLMLMPGLQFLTGSVVLEHVSNIVFATSNSENTTTTVMSARQSSVTLNCSVPNVGLRFVNTVNISISNIEFHFCGLEQDSTSVSSQNKSTTIHFSSALYYLNSTDISISNVSIMNSNGTGVTLFDTGGHVVIKDVYFYNNTIPMSDQSSRAGGGGLYIELTKCTPGLIPDNCGSNSYSTNNHYQIRNCYFLGNVQSNLPNSTTTFISSSGPSWQRFGFGGGLSIALMGLSWNNTFVIDNCSFVSNKAIIGGGMSLMVDDRSEGNEFKLTNNVFTQNDAIHGGGGIEFGFFNVNGTKDTSVEFISCNFISNTALYGGGTSFYSSRVGFSINGNNVIAFRSCKWSNNMALVGAALVAFPESWVSLSSGYLPTILFHDSTFMDNRITRYPSGAATRNASSDSVNGAIVYSSSLSLNFTGDSYFCNNRGSSIHIAVGDINVLENSTIEFRNNFAEKGGAVSLIGYASIIAHKGSKIQFIGNTATHTGGAVYYESSDYLDAVNSRRCFLRYSEVVPVQEWETEFVFVNNTAGNYGKSIYATYLEACARANAINVTEGYDIRNVFRWKPFTFSPGLDSESHIITSDPVHLEINGGHTLITASPGIVTDIEVTAHDGLMQTLNTVLYAACESNCKYGNVSNAYQFISNNKIAFNGTQNKSVTIIAETLTGRVLDIKIEIDIDYCPPGYYIEDGICQCSVSTVHELPGIIACDDDSSRSKMQLGYWAGCITDDNGDLILATGQCPLGYCSYDYQNDGLVLLSNSCSLLSESLCEPNKRQGMLCGECIDGYSVYYHSERFECHTCTYAHYGIPFYILSELLPLTILFTLIIFFDVNLTSGEVTSFILFAQVLDFFDTTAFGVYYIPSWMSYPVKVYKFIFGLLNLEFFKLDALSFCLWDGANVLDVLAFKYVSTFYVLLLIATMFFVMYCCKCKTLKKYRENNYGGYTVTNGLVAFFIITYSQCAKVSFEILTRYEVNVDSNDADYDVVFLSGTIAFFGLEHLKYAIPAVVVIAYTMILPLVLIGQPIYAIITNWRARYKATYRERANSLTSSSSCTAPLWWKKLQLRLKPILDSFQHSFKDKTRWFAGLFFVYRFAISASFAFTVTAASMYSLLEVIVLIMIAVHAIFQPYDNPKHNIVETLMYTNLAIINGISLYNTAITQSRDSAGQAKILATIQLILIYVPIVLFGVHFIVKLIHAQKFKFCSKVNDNSVNVDFTSDTTPDRLLHGDGQTEGGEERRPLLAPYTYNDYDEDDD